MRFLSFKTFSIILIAVVFFSFLQNFIYLDLSSGCFIKLLPSWDFSFNQSVIKDGLIVLKNALPEDYKEVCSRIDTIDPNFDCGSLEGGCYWKGNTKKISVSTSQVGLGWIASVIMHEVCHSKQDFENRPPSEGECYQETDRILKALSVY